MLYPVFFILFALAVIIVLLNTRVKILFEYVRKQSDDNVTLSLFTFGGIIKYKYEVPVADLSFDGIRSRLMRKKGGKEAVLEEEKKILGIKELMERYEYFRILMKTYEGVTVYVKKRALLEQFELEITAGTGDAFSTGLTGGVLWSAAGMITALFENNFRVLKRKVIVNPDFLKKVFEVDLYCIFSLKLVHIIVVAFKILKRFLKAKYKKRKDRR